MTFLPSTSILCNFQRPRGLQKPLLRPQYATAMKLKGVRPPYGNRSLHPTRSYEQSYALHGYFFPSWKLQTARFPGRNEIHRDGQVRSWSVDMRCRCLCVHEANIIISAHSRLEDRYGSPLGFMFATLCPWATHLPISDASINTRAYHAWPRYTGYFAAQHANSNRIRPQALSHITALLSTFSSHIALW
jgi:hypothetical protein